MVYNIIFLNNSEDSFKVNLSEYDGENLYIPSDYNANQKLDAVFNDIKAILDRESLQPGDPAQDVLNLAISVYTADQLISRAIDGYLNWSRHFRVFLPVVNPEKWNSVIKKVEDMLSFLTGDHWEVFVRSRDPGLRTTFAKEKPKVDKVSLFSGGLDSFIGAIDLLESGAHISLVSHHKVGGNENKSQKVLVEALKNQYKDKLETHFPFYVQPNQGHPFAKAENTSRARSILFISLALAVANSYGSNVEVIIPENGLISLNIPLTKTRFGSSSTRTTHPYFLSLLSSVIESLGIMNALRNPYQLKTKGEMILDSMNLNFLKQNIANSKSCAHLSRARFLGSPPDTHCGYCVPCLIRRASLNQANIKDIEPYSIDVLKNPPSATGDTGRDYKAFKMTINRLKKEKPNLLFLILSSGPLTFDNSYSLEEYKAIYGRGIKEVESFLNAKT